MNKDIICIKRTTELLAFIQSMTVALRNTVISYLWNSPLAARYYVQKTNSVTVQINIHLVHFVHV